MTLIAALVALAALSTHPQAPAHPEVKPHIQVELITQWVQLKASEEIELGARIVIPEGWRIGWENPGDVGAPTSARLEVPDGFDVHGPAYPAPHLFTLDDGRTCFGYERETVLFFHVKPPSTLAASQHVEFRVQASWTAVGTTQVSGHGRATLVMPTLPLEAPPPAAAADALARSRSELPRPWKQLDQAKLQWVMVYADTGEGSGLELRLEVEGADQLTYFPRPVRGLEYAGQSFAKSASGARLVVAYQGVAEKGVPSPNVQGVLRVERGGAGICYDVRADRPQPVSGD